MGSNHLRLDSEKSTTVNVERFVGVNSCGVRIL